MSTLYTEPAVLQSDLDSLIILHLNEIYDANKRIQSLQQKIALAIDNLSEEWAKRNDWDFKFDFNGGEFWAAPKKWKIDGKKDDFIAYFEFYTMNNTEDGETWLPSLCGCGGSKYGFRFVPTQIRSGRKGSKIGSLSEEITKFGFIIDEVPSIFWPVVLNSSDILEAFQGNSIERALEPIQQAFDRILEARPLFDDLMERARAQSA